MVNRSRACLLVFLLMFSLVPQVSADSGRYATYVSFSPSTVGIGGTVSISADVTGKLLDDDTQTTRYNIRVENIDTDESYTVAQNLDAVEDEVEFDWQVPTSIATGAYLICVEEADGEREYERCSNIQLSITRYHLEMEVNNEIMLPGETLRVWSNVYSPIDGSPEIPESSGWDMRYYTVGEESWEVDSQFKSGVLTPSAENEFAILMPSNLHTGYSISVTFYANDSSGTQVSQISRNIAVGTLSTTITSPFNSQVIGLGADFMFSVSCKRIESWDWMPEAGLSLTAKIEQASVKAPVVISPTLVGQPDTLKTDGDGIVSLLLSAYHPSLIVGPADLKVFWTDPSSGEMVNTSVGIYLSESSEANLSGMGLRLVIEGPVAANEPGDNVTLTITSYDLADNPLPGVWIHHMTSRQTQTSEEDNERWMAVQTGSDGTTQVQIMIPEDLNTGSGRMTFNVKGWNSTGYTTSDTHEIELIDTEANLHPSTLEWLPGETVEMNLDVKEMQGMVAAFWTVNELDLSGSLTFDSTKGGVFSFEIPERTALSWVVVRVDLIDEAGMKETTQERVDRLDGFNLMISVEEGVHEAGDVLSIEYSIDSMDPENPVDFPLQWAVTISGLTNSGKVGLADKGQGTIEYQIPEDLETGSYLIAVIFQEQAAYLLIDVRSTDDASGVGGSFSSAGDTLNAASGWISIISLLMAGGCLFLLRRGGGGSKEEDLGGYMDPPSPIVPAPQPAQIPAPMPVPTAVPTPQPMPAYDPTSPTGYAMQPPPPGPY